MDYIGMFPYKHMPSRPSKVTESPTFIEIKLNKVRRQRNMFKMKENERSPEKNPDETNNLQQQQKKSSK